MKLKKLHDLLAYQWDLPRFTILRDPHSAYRITVFVPKKSNTEEFRALLEGRMRHGIAVTVKNLPWYRNRITKRRIITCVPEV